MGQSTWESKNHSRTENMDLFKGQELFKADETKVSADEVLKDKDFVLLYFSAHWCPPCKAFTPKLKEFYNEVKDKKVEIIFVSGDQSPKAMYDYMKESHGDWFVVEHESKLSDDLNEKFQVSGIPTLVVLKEDGTVVTKGGRGDVGNHGAGALEVWNTTIMDVLKDQKFRKLDGSEISTETLTSTKSLDSTFPLIGALLAVCSLQNLKSFTKMPKMKVSKSFFYPLIVMRNQ